MRKSFLRLHNMRDNWHSVWESLAAFHLGNNRHAICKKGCSARLRRVTLRIFARFAACVNCEIQMKLGCPGFCTRRFEQFSLSFSSYNLTCLHHLIGKFSLSKKRDEIALWTGVDRNGSIHDGDGTIGHGLTMDIARGFIYSWAYLAVMLVLPTLTKRLLN